MRILGCCMAILCCTVAGGLGALNFRMAPTRHDGMALIRDDGVAVIRADRPTVSTTTNRLEAQAVDGRPADTHLLDAAQTVEAQAGDARPADVHPLGAAQTAGAQGVDARPADAHPLDAAPVAGAPAADAPPLETQAAGDGQEVGVRQVDVAHPVRTQTEDVAHALEAEAAEAHPVGIPAVGVQPIETHPIDISEIDRVDECIDATVCIDRYLWSLYERTTKIDTIRVPQEVKVAVKRKGRIRIITRTVSKFVVENFAWKDPDAARKAGMSPQDYVIGGMDPAFRVTLYHALRALDDAGLMPGITSAFRDDYRQTIASGQKARSDRSFHGGSFRGGYGHGLAADVVSVKGATHAEQLASSDVLWKWIDAHEKELGIGRPYLDRDAPHVGPLDGSEYLSRRGGATAHVIKGRQRLVAVLHHDHGGPKRTRLGRPVRVQSRSTHST
jgi:hypothetical protein